MNTLLVNTAVPARQSRRARLITADRFVRITIHITCWVPFVTAVGDSWRGPWRAVGDNARMALESWNTLSGHIPLVGQPNELPGAPHDLGPLQYWLLTVPVHADPARGVLWGAALLAIAAISLAIEAGYSVRGEIGGFLAGGVVVAMVAWFPGFATRPEDNPNFSLLIFLAALSACLAVLCGHRNWWPVLVVTASVAAQAHLMFAAASVALVLVAAGTGLADEFRSKQGGYSWLVTGLIAGVACWIAPLDQQFFGTGPGNMSNLLHAASEVRPAGAAFALSSMGSLAAPSSLWWQQDISQRQHLYETLGGGPAAAGLAVLAVTAAGLVIAGRWLRSRELAGLAAISLLVGVAAAADFALMPGSARALAQQQHDLVFVMFTAVLLGWLTAICVTTRAAVKLAERQRGQAAPAAAAEGQEPGAPTCRPPGLPLFARGATALLLLTVTLSGAIRQIAGYAGPGANSLHVTAALGIIQRSLPAHSEMALSVTPRADRFQVLIGLCWALAVDGYHPDTYHPEPAISRLNHFVPGVAVVIHGPASQVMMTNHVNQVNRGIWTSCTSH